MSNLNQIIDSTLSFGIALDVVWAIWATFADYHSRSLPPVYYASDASRDFDQCVRMTDTALQKGCDIESSISSNPNKANALFEMDGWWSLSSTHRSAPGKAIDCLVNKGYDLEARNATGQTPLLHTATTQKPQCVMCLTALIRKGANVCAVDLMGRGALHCALSTPDVFDSWRNLRLVSLADHTVSRHHYLIAYVYHTETAAHAEDFEDLDEDGPRIIPDADLSVSNSFAGGCICGFKADSDVAEAQAANGSFLDPVTLVCEDFQGNQLTVRHPIQVLKKRLRFKLLALLRANSDPNAFDNIGATPSDYAKRDGLWPQWT